MPESNIFLKLAGHLDWVLLAVVVAMLIALAARKPAGLQQLTVSALLIALDVVFTRVLAINTPLVKGGLGFTAVVVSAMLYGPVWAMLTAALGDLVGALMFPTGAYYWGFTATAALTGLIFGLYLYRKEGKWLRAFLAALTNCFFVTLVLNTALIVYKFGASLQAMAASRIPQFFIMTAVQTAVIAALQASPAMLRLIREKSMGKSEKNP